MSSALSQSVVFVGLGARGARVVDELAQTAAALHTPEGPPHCSVTSSLLNEGRFRRQLQSALTTLVETGAGRTHGQVRLDIPVVVDAAEVEPEHIMGALGVIVDMLRKDYPVVFPPDAPPEQRSVWLTLHLGTPPLVATPAGQAFALLLDQVDAFARTAHPLSRVLLLPRQTSAGRLDDEGFEDALRALLQSLFLSGAREEDRIRRLLGHRSDDRCLANVAVATAELPLARIRNYARWRLALAGLSTLSAQAERPLQDSARVETIFQQLDVRPLLNAFTDGDTAVRVRARAAKLSGAADNLPETWKVAVMDSAPELRSHYRVLFEPIAKPWSRRTDPTTDPDHEAMLRAVDRAEFDALQEADRRVLTLLDEEIDPRTALSVLPAVEHALKQVLHDLDEELANQVPTLPSPEPPAPPDDPGLVELSRIVDSRPGLKRTWVVLGMLFVGTGALTMLGFSWLLAEPIAAGAILSSPIPPTRVEAWVAGALLGLFTAATWQIGVLFSWRQTTSRALERRTHELEAAWRRGGAGQERQQAEQLLAVHRRRTAHDLHRRFGFALERLAALRAAIRQSTQTAHTALVDLRVRPGEHPRNDDVRGLLGANSPLQRSLVEAEALPQLLEATDALRDPDRWAARILAGTWPRSGLSRDLPCVDEAAILATCDEVLGPIRPEQLLIDATPQIRSFLSQAPSALGWGVQPRDAHGDPLPGTGRDERFVIAPRSLRVAVEGALADSPVQLRPLYTEASAPWVNILAAWDGFTAADVIRGMGIPR